MDIGPARSLTDIIGVFDPHHPLDGGALNAYYAERNLDGRKRMQIFLGMAADNPVKILFTGHMGSGKSTELNQLVTDLGNSFFVVKVRTSDIVAATDLTYIDVIIITAMALFREAASAGLVNKAPAQIIDDAWDDVGRMINNVIFGKEPIRTRRGNLPMDEVVAKIGASAVQGLTVEFGTRFKDDANTRQQIRERMKDQLSEVIHRMDLISGEVQRRYGKPVLIVIEDTDKAEKARARDIFFEHPQTLTGFNASVIYTFPIDLRYSVEWTDTNRYFRAFRLSNVVLSYSDGRINEEGWNVMRLVLARRAQSDLFGVGIADKLIGASGGVMRYLIGFVQEAAINASSRRASRIEDKDAERAISEVRKDFEAVLHSDDYPYLARRHEDHLLSSDDQLQRLLRLRALLEYENGDTWCEVHPAILPLVERRNRP